KLIGYQLFEENYLYAVCFDELGDLQYILRFRLRIGVKPHNRYLLQTVISCEISERLMRYDNIFLRDGAELLRIIGVNSLKLAFQSQIILFVSICMVGIGRYKAVLHVLRQHKS